MTDKELVFIAMPSGVLFGTPTLQTSVECLGFFKAHLYAAQQAAVKKAPTYVLRTDTGDTRYGFGPGAMFSPTSVLYKIVQLGVRAIWDYDTKSWVPFLETEDNTSMSYSKSNERIG